MVSEWEVTRAGNMEDVHRGDRFIFDAERLSTTEDLEDLMNPMKMKIMK